MMDMGYLNARWVLGWALVKHVLLWPLRRRDPHAWVRRIGQEALAPTPQQGWATFAATSRCIGCGLCDAVVPAEVQASAWLQGSIRQPADAPLALQQAALLRQHAAAIMRICPARVQVDKVADLIDMHARMLREPAPMAQPKPPA